MINRSRPSHVPLIHCPGAVPFGIGENDGSGNPIGLFVIVGSHRVATGSKALFEPGQHFFISLEDQSQRLGDRFASQVVFGGAKAAHEDHDVGAKKSMLRDRDEPVAAVSDDGFEDDLNPKLIELFGEVERICVLPERSEQLRADGDDLGVHGRSLNDERR